MMRVLALLLAAGLAQAAVAGETPSVLVKTESAVKGELPRIVTGYGSTAPAPGAATTISVQYDGQVADLAVSADQTVHTGDRLLRIVPSAAVLSAFDQAQTALRLARAELAHATQMRGQQLATRDQVAQAEKAVADAQTQIDTFTRQGVGPDMPPIEAPFDGVVSAVAVSQGDRVQANAPLVTLGRNGGMILVAGIEPPDRSLVKPRDKVRMTVASDSGQVFPGEVTGVGGQVDPKSRLVPLRIARTDGQPLTGNQDIRAEITVGEATGWKLPRTAVLTDDKGAYVFQVDGDKARRVDVSILVDGGDTLLVDGNLVDGRKLVTDGAYQLSDGMTVRSQ